MNPTQILPTITTDDLKATRSYYLDVLGFEVVMESPEYLQVRYPGGPDVSFIISGEGFAPMGKGSHRANFDGKGIVLGIPVADVDSTAANLKSRGASLLMEPEDKPWGWRSFFVRDPNGVVLDFCRPAEGTEQGQGAA